MSDLKRDCHKMALHWCGNLADSASSFYHFCFVKMCCPLPNFLFSFRVCWLFQESLSSVQDLLSFSKRLKAVAFEVVFFDNRRGLQHRVVGFFVFFETTFRKARHHHLSCWLTTSMFTTRSSSSWGPIPATKAHA